MVAQVAAHYALHRPHLDPASAQAASAVPTPTRPHPPARPRPGLRRPQPAKDGRPGIARPARPGPSHRRRGTALVRQGTAIAPLPSFFTPCGRPARPAGPWRAQGGHWHEPLLGLSPPPRAHRRRPHHPRRPRPLAPHQPTAHPEDDHRPWAFCHCPIVHRHPPRARDLRRRPHAVDVHVDMDDHPPCRPTVQEGSNSGWSPSSPTTAAPRPAPLPRPGRAPGRAPGRPAGRRPHGIGPGPGPHRRPAGATLDTISAHPSATRQPPGHGAGSTPTRRQLMASAGIRLHPMTEPPP
jgi:hypothetical protein